MGPRPNALKLTNLLLFATCTCKENQGQGSNYWLWSFTLVTSNKYPIFFGSKGSWKTSCWRNHGSKAQGKGGEMEWKDG